MTQEEKEAAVRTNLAYLFADLMESSLMDMEEAANKAGFRIIHEDRRSFNTAIKAVRKLKMKVGKLPISEQENYGDSSDKIYQLILLLVDRCSRDGINIKSLAYQLLGLKSLLGIKIDLSVYEEEE